MKRIVLLSFPVIHHNKHSYEAEVMWPFVQRTPQRKTGLTSSLKWKWWRWLANTRTSSTCWEPVLRMVSVWRTCVSAAVRGEPTLTLTCVSRASVCARGVRLKGEPAGLPPCSQTSRAGVLEQLQASFSGQLGDHGAGFCCLPGGQRNGLPGIKEGPLARLVLPYLLSSISDACYSLFLSVVCSVSTETWQPGTFWSQKIMWWRSPTSAWRGMSTILTTTRRPLM